MFKKILLFSCLFLVACQSGTEETAKHQDLWQEIVNVNSNYDNYHAVMDSKQNMAQNGKVVSANAAIDLYINEVPYISRQIVNIQLDHTQSPPTQYYINDNYVYTQIPADFNWYMLQAKEYEDTKNEVKAFANHLKDQVELLHHYNSEYEMKESKHLYTFKIDQKSNLFTELYVHLANNALPNDFGSILDTIDIDRGHVEINIDKKDHKLRKIKTYAVYKTKVKGIDAEIEQSILDIYTKQNKTSVPINQEAIDKAEIL